MEVDFAPAIGRFAVSALIAATAEGGGVLFHHLAQVATPAVRQKRSKRAPTASQASVTRAVAFTAERVLVVVRALPFSVDSTPRAYTLKAGNADSLFQHGAGHARRAGADPCVGSERFASSRHKRTPGAAMRFGFSTGCIIDRLL